MGTDRRHSGEGNSEQFEFVQGAKHHMSRFITHTNWARICNYGNFSKCVILFLKDMIKVVSFHAKTRSSSPINTQHICKPRRHTNCLSKATSKSHENSQKFNKVVKTKTPFVGTLDPKSASYIPPKGPRSHPQHIPKTPPQ